MKKNILLLLSLCLVMLSCEKETDPTKSTPDGKEPYVYLVKKMGTLGSILNKTQKDTIVTMIVKGEINAADFYVMKRMPQLRHLNLKDVKCEGDEIPKRAFADNNSGIQVSKITTIVLPISITTLGEYSFSICSDLTGPLILPDGLTSIGKWAFQDCSGLKGILTIPAGITTLAEGAFGGAGFTGVNLPAGLTEIGMATFYLCKSLTGLTLPAGLKTIGVNAFNSCIELTGDVIFPKSLEIIEKNGFLQCPKVTAYQFPHDKVFPFSENMMGGRTTIRVPENLIASYLVADGWKDYKGNIVKIE